MASPSKLVVPQVEGQRFRWSFGDVSFEVDAQKGARITTFRFGAENILSGPEVNPLNFGSTFWTSPQSDWAWPPTVEIDSAPYDVSGTGADVWFRGGAGSLGIAVAKRFRVNADDEAIEIEYVMENRSNQVRSVAPWEISRVPLGGLTFFPAAEGSIQKKSNLDVREVGGAIWVDNDPNAIADHRKLFARGSEGWIGHVDIERRMLLIKTFPRIDPGQEAPGEAEIELYVDPAHTYLEVEQQGAYGPLGPAEKRSWQVIWRLRRLPAGIEATAGNRDLLALGRAFKARDQVP